MKPKFQLLLLLLMIAAITKAQTDTAVATPAGIAQKHTSAAPGANGLINTSPICILGDPAPLLRVGEWLKGTPVASFEKGKIYVVEFWATWCYPCLESMPHLSALARKYKGKVTFSAISVLESRGSQGATIEKLRGFVARMGNKMDMNVASEDTGFTVHDWLRDYKYDYIPVSFIVNGEGRVVWNGHPHSLDTVLKKVLNNTWDMNAELARRAYEDSHASYLMRVDTSVRSKVRRFLPTYNGRNYLGFADSTLMVIDEMVKTEPKVKYAPNVAGYTFTALLLTDQHKAYEYGMQVLKTTTYEGPAYESIIDDIWNDSIHLTTSKEIYLLGAACYQAKINDYPKGSIYELGRYYHEMSEWYYKGGDIAKAIDAEKKVLKFWGMQLKDEAK